MKKSIVAIGILLMVILHIAGCTSEVSKTVTDKKSDVIDMSEEEVKEELYNQAINLFEKENYIEAWEIFSELKYYEDSSDKAKKSLFNLALQKYELKDYWSTLLLLDKLGLYKGREEYIIQCLNIDGQNIYEKAKSFIGGNNNKDALSILRMINKNCSKTETPDLFENNMYYVSYAYDCEIKNGIWSSVSSDEKFIVIDNDSVFIHLNTSNLLDKVYKIVAYDEFKYNLIGEREGCGFVLDNGMILSVTDTNLIIFNQMGDIVEEVFSQEYIEGVKKLERYLDSIKKEEIKFEPSIGMTIEELEQSTWGKPYEINTRKYVWGTTQQWCYSDYRYVYLEDGIVTAISE